MADLGNTACRIDPTSAQTLIRGYIHLPETRTMLTHGSDWVHDRYEEDRHDRGRYSRNAPEEFERVDRGARSDEYDFWRHHVLCSNNSHCITGTAPKFASTTYTMNLHRRISGYAISLDSLTYDLTLPGTIRAHRSRGVCQAAI